MDDEEFVDVFDKQGRKTGKVLPKSEVHDKSLWHSGAHLWIYNSKSEVLLQHRCPTKFLFPNTWDISAAGHITAGDGPIDTIVREVEEELGLKINPKDLQFIGITVANQKLPGGWIHRALDWTYMIKKDIDLKKLKLQKTEVDDACWKPMDEFESDIKDHNRFKQYSPREKYIYQLAITEMKKGLAGL